LLNNLNVASQQRALVLALAQHFPHLPPAWVLQLSQLRDRKCHHFSAEHSKSVNSPVNCHETAMALFGEASSHLNRFKKIHVAACKGQPCRSTLDSM
jgi:hypothetical protein